MSEIEESVGGESLDRVNLDDGELVGMNEIDKYIHLLANKKAEDSALNVEYIENKIRDCLDSLEANP